MPCKTALFLFFFCVISFAAAAQTIRGEVLDNDDKLPISDVNIVNIYTSLSVSTSEQGAFIIAAAGGQLLEFRKEGFKTVRARIPQGYIPSYFRIVMKRGFSDIKSTNLAQQTNRYNYSADSTRFHDFYKSVLDFPKMSGIDMVASPFSALSRKNQEIWRFQEDYERFEKEKYVDRTFNETVITRYTALTGDSLRYFMRRFRPTYDQLKNMNDYSFFNFIKTGAYHYRNAVQPANSR
ncbi:MAG: hypothetical protein JWQ38_1370 [Flavipsychrobacter sp.]|nr:hypothetical protein [Flavipsychrobacter sp.]